MLTDIHKIVDIFTRQVELPGYSRMVPVNEIADARNNYNLNLPRYIDATEPEDIQDIGGHLQGGIPERDIVALDRFWAVIPGVRVALFESAGRPGYAQLRVPTAEIRPSIFDHPEFIAFNATAGRLFDTWRGDGAATQGLRHNTVHLGVQKPHITDRVFWDRQRWRVFLPACQPAFV